MYKEFKVIVDIDDNEYLTNNDVLNILVKDFGYFNMIKVEEVASFTGKEMKGFSKK